MITLIELRSNSIDLVDDISIMKDLVMSENDMIEDHLEIIGNRKLSDESPLHLF